MKVISKIIEEIQSYENNPRKNDGAVEAVAASIHKFGFKVPIIIDSDNTVIAGHTRLKAAMQLGMDEVPCIVADDLTPEQVKAFRLADNKTGELADWNYELLDIELDGILDIDMSEFGFEQLSDSLIDDLINEEFIEGESDPKYFDITFVIEIGHREAVDKYIKENGKAPLVNRIVEEVSANA